MGRFTWRPDGVQESGRKSRLGVPDGRPWRKTGSDHGGVPGLGTSEIKAMTYIGRTEEVIDLNCERESRSERGAAIRRRILHKNYINAPAPARVTIIYEKVGETHCFRSPNVPGLMLAHPDLDNLFLLIEPAINTLLLSKIPINSSYRLSKTLEMFHQLLADGLSHKDRHRSNRVPSLSAVLVSCDSQAAII